MNLATHIDIKQARVKLFINTLLIDYNGEINNTWYNWIYEVRLFLNFDNDTFNVYNNIVNDNYNSYLPRHNELINIINNINALNNGSPHEYEFCRNMWFHLYH
jgi:hypothetical protein